jgi:hypothetical protein
MATSDQLLASDPLSPRKEPKVSIGLEANFGPKNYQDAVQTRSSHFIVTILTFRMRNSLHQNRVICPPLVSMPELPTASSGSPTRSGQDKNLYTKSEWTAGPRLFVPASPPLPLVGTGKGCRITARSGSFVFRIWSGHCTCRRLAKLAPYSRSDYTHHRRRYFSASNKPSLSRRCHSCFVSARSRVRISAREQTAPTGF